MEKVICYGRNILWDKLTTVRLCIVISFQVFMIAILVLRQVLPFMLHPTILEPHFHLMERKLVYGFKKSFKTNHPPVFPLDPDWQRFQSSSVDKDTCCSGIPFQAPITACWCTRFSTFEANRFPRQTLLKIENTKIDHFLQ